ncbi:hypothetical protein EJC49_21450 [Aquibium carbonis]|uniref:Uncharacterized protein n=1 Tax=Aquibium carbonis TaxID=2495581 RepID=A0A429YS87_9HYPH|nr:hypothetical protein [Aquibium carbonis]RST84317.1 hypothetical protein EJC49_21450 [Aquibium carbonis]
MTRRNNRRSGMILAADLMLAPMVATMRLPLMLSEPRGSGVMGVETLKAVTEKSAAFAEGLMAANLSYVTSMMSFWPEVLAGKTPSLLSGAALEHSLHAALKPSGKRVRANFRRLSRPAL